MAKTHSVDLTRGSVLKKLVAFAFPLWLSALIQQLYHAADVVVVGRFAENSTAALAAVGSTGTLTSMILNLFLGLSVGSSVRCANLYGAEDKKGLERVMSTALISAVIGGILVAVIGIVFSGPLLKIMGTPDSVIDLAGLYMRIIFLGKPAALIYNTCSGIMRAHGESKRPMYILSATGFVNVVLNMILVIGFHMDVAGVAIATITAEWLSAAVAVYLLFHPLGEYGMRLNRMPFDRKEFLKILRIGVPAGFNGVIFNVSNAVVISTVNAMGAVAMAAVSAATSISSILYTIPSAFATACVSFSGQNYGAKKFDRIDRLLWGSIGVVFSIFVVGDVILTLFPRFFLRFYTTELVVIETAIPKLLICSWGYLIYTISEMANGCQRGFGKSLGPTLLNMVAICTTRIGWTFFVFPHLPQTLFWLYLCFPLSWSASAVAQIISYYSVKKKKMRLAFAEEKTE